MLQKLSGNVQVYTIFTLKLEHEGPNSKTSYPLNEPVHRHVCPVLQAEQLSHATMVNCSFKDNVNVLLHEYI